MSAVVIFVGMYGGISCEMRAASYTQDDYLSLCMYVSLSLKYIGEKISHCVAYVSYVHVYSLSVCVQSSVD
jgi:hypothetical protein